MPLLDVNDAGNPESSTTQPSSLPSVFVVVLNWNCWLQTLECLRFLDKLDYPNWRAMVVDNGSTDDSERQIRVVRPDVLLIQTGTNLGYAGGNNVGIRYALGEGASYVLVVNPDVALEPAALSLLVSTFQQLAGVGALSPVIRWRTRPHSVWFGGSRISWWTAKAVHEHAAPPPTSMHHGAWASGCCLLLASEALKRVGLFDETLFLYWEEADLCQRLLAAGYTVGVCPRASAFHGVSAVVGVDSPRGWYYFTRNGLYFFRRYASHHGVWTWLAVSILLFRYVILGTARAVLSRDGTARARLRGSIDFLRGRTGQAAG